MNNKFIELTLGNHTVLHGYDKNNKEIIEEVVVDSFSKKLVTISRIKSISEKYILTDYIDGRWIFWEYKEDFESLRNKI